LAALIGKDYEIAGWDNANFAGLVKWGRNKQLLRQRYLRISKETLVERLITAERSLAE